MNTPDPIPPSSPAPSDRGYWGAGVAWMFACVAMVAPLGFVVAVIGPLFNSELGYAGIGVWVLFGLSQFVFVIPLVIWLHRRGKRDTALGLWISAGVVLLLNGACSGLMVAL